MSMDIIRQGVMWVKAERTGDESQVMLRCNKAWEGELWWGCPLRAIQWILSLHKSRGSVSKRRWKEGALGRILSKDPAGGWWPQDEGLESGRWKWKGRGQSQNINYKSQPAYQGQRGRGWVSSFSDRHPAQGFDCAWPAIGWAVHGLCAAIWWWWSARPVCEVPGLAGRAWPGRVLGVDVGVCWGSFGGEGRGGDTGVLKSLLFLKGAISLHFWSSLVGHHLAQGLAQSRHLVFIVFLNTNNELTIVGCLPCSRCLCILSKLFPITTLRWG